MSDPDKFDALLADLRLLVQKANAKGESYSDTSSRQHYWYGLKSGYADAADRLEMLLEENQSQIPG